MPLVDMRCPRCNAIVTGDRDPNAQSVLIVKKPPHPKSLAYRLEKCVRCNHPIQLTEGENLGGSRTWYFNHRTVVGKSVKVKKVRK